MAAVTGKHQLRIKLTKKVEKRRNAGENIHVAYIYAHNFKKFY